MGYRAVIFDLDGTLVDSLDDIANSMNFVLKQHGHPEHQVDDYRWFIGNGVRRLVIQSLPRSHRKGEIVEQCLNEIKIHYAENWNMETKPYPGILDLLKALQTRRIQCSVHSNKPDEFTKKMVSYYFADYRFTSIRGADTEVPNKPDPAGALIIANDSSLSPNKFLYVGDSGVDMQTAIAAGMKPVGVSWGFRPKKELLECGAFVILDRPLDLLAHLE